MGLVHTPFSFGQLFQCSSVGFEPLAVAWGDSERKEGMVIYTVVGLSQM